jgi:hypothetical protein
VLDVATAILGGAPVAEPGALSAKYARGSALFEQGFHIDPLYAVYATRATPSVRMWVYLTDVTSQSGPTELHSLDRSFDDLSLFDSPTADFSGYYDLSDVPLIASEVNEATAPAGSVLFYQARTHHRATRFTGSTGCRWIATYGYRSSGRPWLGTSWDLTRSNGVRIRPDFAKLTVAERNRLGFPPPGDPHWDEQRARAEAVQMYPGLDLTPYL